jgi:hypothetical protein
MTPQNLMRNIVRMTETETHNPPSPVAIRMRRYRERRKQGVRCVQIKLTDHAIRAMVENGFLEPGRLGQRDIELGFYALLNAARRAGVIRPRNA